jgi:formylglycine-generating enzyme required for sulfatase activity
VIVDLSVTPAVHSAGSADLRVSLRRAKLSGFDEESRPLYERGAESRTIRFEVEEDTALALLIPDPREKESFAIHDVLLRLRAGALEQGSGASYGTLSVTANVPGAEVLLDGGLVGRTSQGGPTLVRNVLAGQRDVRVRDFSGREVGKDVVVEADRMAEVALSLLDLAAPGKRNGLVAVGKNPQGHEEYWRVRDGAFVVRVEEGDFLMGSPAGEGEPHEQPQHRVSVSEYLIDKTEVTWRQFRSFAEAAEKALPPEPVSGAADDLPVSNVLWEEAREYCEWVGGRVPTEAEWEKAARGADGRRYPWGEEWDPDRCNSWEGGPNRPEAAGSYPSCVSPYGVLDMAGNLWEWCADWYGESYYAQSPRTNPTGPTSGELRVLRGGAWNTQPLWLRAPHRHRTPPTSRNVTHGFRCVQDAPE